MVPAGKADAGSALSQGWRHVDPTLRVSTSVHALVLCIVEDGRPAPKGVFPPLSVTGALGGVSDACYQVQSPG